MAYSEKLDSASWKTEVDNGQTSTGAVRTASIGMGAIDANAWDVEKAGAILAALIPCLSKTYYRSIHTVNNKLVGED